MSTDFIPTLVEDDRLILSSKLPFEVYQGASSISPQLFAANTQTGSSHTYTVTVPSYESITDMNILWDGDIVFTITGTPANGEYLVNLGNTTAGQNSDCLAPFPFLNALLVLAATVNQSQCSVNAQDVLLGLLPCISRETLSQYNSMTPTMLDNTQSYSQANAGYPSSVFKTYSDSNNYKIQPRGSWYVKSMITPSTGLNGNILGAANTPRTVTVTVHVTEPLGILSPFLFAKSGGAGISGVQAINFNMTLDQAGLRSWRSTSTLQTVTMGYSNSQLLVTFLSPKASQLVKYAPRNILPYSQLQVYKSNSQPAGPAGAVQKINTPSIQLSSIPKMALLFVRPVNRSYNTADYVLPIVQINCNFNGRNGILSGATQQQLYAMSCDSGVQQSWQEWSGVAGTAFAATTAGGITTGAPTSIFTTGGILALTFSKHLECSSEYDAVSSIGQFNLAFNVSYSNDCGSAGNVELYLVLVNEGIFATERGQSSTYTSILSKSDVMSVINDVPLSDVPNSQTLPIDGSEVLTGGRRRAGRGISGGGQSGGGRSAGAMKKLNSYLM